MFHCNGCHSDYLQTDCGEELTESVIDDLIKKNHGINCFLFMGDGNDTGRLVELANYIKLKYPNISLAIYSGYDDIRDEYVSCFKYIKTGKYVSVLGPLNSKETNQRLYVNDDGVFNEITYKFWNRK